MAQVRLRILSKSKSKQGYGQATGRPAAVIVHVDVGTQALAGAIHNVDKNRVRRPHALDADRADASLYLRRSLAVQLSRRAARLAQRVHPQVR